MLAADPVIVEFQADNSSTIADEDGDWSDWIELQNPDTQPVSLAGWYLTDNLNDLNQWRFPAVTLEPGGHLLVFASGKNRAHATGELHTNFRLSADGESLALVRPDGSTIAHVYESYPAQYTDQSYGLAVGRDIVSFVSSQAPARTWVPTNGDLQQNWTQPNFDDSSWQSGNLAVGYEVLQSGQTVRDDFAGPLGPEWTIDRPNASSSVVSVEGGTLRLNVPLGEDLGHTTRGTAPFVARAVPGDSPGDWEVITEIRQPSTDRGAAGLAIIDAATGGAAIQLEYNARLSFRLLSGTVSMGAKVGLNRDHYFLRLTRDSQTASWTGYYKLNEADDWTLVASVSDAEGASAIEQPMPAVYARSPSSRMNAQFEFVEFVVPDQRPVYGPLINTNLQTRMQGQNSSLYIRVPFDVAGDAARFDEMTLLTRMDDGFQAYLNGTPVTSHNVPIDATWNSAASGIFGAVNGQIPLQSFTLNEHAHLLRPGANVLAIHAMNASSTDIDFFFDAFLSGAEILNQTAQYFASPTPGVTNQAPAAPPARIVGAQGLFFDMTTVELQLDAPNPRLQIRYSLDGSEPTATSALYTGPLVLRESAMLQARVFDMSLDGAIDPSPIVGGTFIALDNELKGRTSDIPLIVLDTLGQSLPGSSSTTLRAVNVVAMEVSQASGRSSLDAGLPNFVGRGGIRDRGSSTSGQQKPNLAFETWASAGTQDDDDEDVSLLGFAADSDWVLHAPYTYDPALIRNQIAYEMANSIGRWAPGTRAVEVYLNRRDGVVDESDYAGVYVLVEKIKQGPDRVDITEISRNDNQEPDISGGYMWKIDREDPGEPAFAAGGVMLNWVEPKSPNSRLSPESQRATSQQQAWVVDYFNKFRDASRSPDINDPEGYSKYIDVLSWVDHNLVSVLGDNVDALNLSTYLFKDRGGKIEYGPQWDFDRSMESLDDRDNDPLKWGGSGGTAFLTSNLWGPLFRDPGFWQVYVDRWTELRRGPFSDESLDAMIDKFANEVAESQQRNFARWVGVRPRTGSTYNSGRLDGTWRGEVEHLRVWLHARADFIDGNFAQPPTLFQQESVVPVGGTQVQPGTVIRVDGPQLVYYDDTEFISSEPGAVTASYFSPSDDSLGTAWTQPAFNDGAWLRGPLGLGMDGASNFTDMIHTQARPAPDGTTILLRVPFQLDNLDQLDSLVLRMRYDDGYVAYLNGTEVIRRGVRDADLTWNSRATSRQNSVVLLFEDVDISEHRHLLNTGDNVLAIRLINASTTNNDLFVQPALVRRKELFGVSPVGDVYYTTDGTDPRGPDGNPAPSATLAPRGQEVSVHENTRIIARTFDNVTDRGVEARSVRTNWSAPVEYDFVVQSPNLKITELNYHPAPPTASEAESGFLEGDFEFVEVYNAGATVADLRGVHLADGVEFDFYGSAVSSLAPGQFALVVANQQAFQQRYGGDLPVAGQFTGNLNNAGEAVELVTGAGTVLFSVNYGDNDRWGEAADGRGATLELIDPARVAPTAHDKWYSWQTSSRPGGTPGQAREMPPGIVINEVLARTAQRDAIELYNTTDQTISIGGWYLSDSAGTLAKFPIPAGTQLGPGQYVVFDERHFNADPPLPGAQSFALSGEGESVWLVQLDAAGNVVRFVDDVHFGATRSGESLGRWPNAQGRLAPLQNTSLGSANGAARVGPLVISELQYNPRLSDAALAQDPTLDASSLEFVEIHNSTATTVDLTQWRLGGGVDYEFASGLTLAPGGSVLVLPFDPLDSENVNRLNAFRAHYRIGEQVRLVGGYIGRLDNRDDHVALLRPEIVSTNPTILVHTTEDEMLYDDLLPWPTGADGQGGSLQRRSPFGLGNVALSWFSAPASPGAMTTTLPGDFDSNGVVAALDIDLLSAQLRGGGNLPAFDLDRDGSVTVSDRDVLVQVILGTTYGDANLDGIFNSSDLVQVFQRGHFEDAIVGNSGWMDGDWDGNGEFSTSDIVYVFQRGGYVPASIDANLLKNGMLTASKPVVNGLVAEAVDAVWGAKTRVLQRGRLRV